MLPLLAPVYLGWSLGANDASNVFGTAVSTRMVRFRTAAVFGSVFVVVGALVQGDAGMVTVGGLSRFDAGSALIASLGAALTVTLMTVLRLPVSTSQAVVGAIIGVGLLGEGIETGGLVKIVLCWLSTPFGGLVFAMALYRLLTPLFDRLAHQLIIYDAVLRISLVVTGCYGAYALGANNVANVTGIYVGAGILSPPAAALIGGGSIALGILTFSRRVMSTVGRGIVGLSAYSALIAVLAHSVTVHVYAVVGVPVSSSQAIVGSVLGVGILKSAETVRLRAIAGILSGWLATPVIGALFAAGLFFVANLRYVP
ncbi:MAG: anion permease [Acidobacteriota bacterium]|nr:MAG: anion permease [Acidobacteriota bacterium]